MITTTVSQRATLAYHHATMWAWHDYTLSRNCVSRSWCKCNSIYVGLPECDGAGQSRLAAMCGDYCCRCHFSRNHFSLRHSRCHFSERHFSRYHFSKGHLARGCPSSARVLHSSVHSTANISPSTRASRISGVAGRSLAAAGGSVRVVRLCVQPRRHT